MPARRASPITPGAPPRFTRVIPVETLSSKWVTPSIPGPRAQGRSASRWRPSSSRARGPRLLVSLSAPPRSSSTESRGRWLVQLRWLALGGMTVTIFAAELLVPALALAPLLAVLLAIVIANVGWSALLERRGPGSDPEGHIAAQLSLDTLFLCGLLWFSGGLDNPFAVFLTFQIALAGILCGGRVSLLVGVLALGAIGALSWAPGLPLDGAPIGREKIQLRGRLASLASLTFFLGFFALVYARRLDELRDESARNEKLAMLGRLVGGMSHELSTPLATILLGSRDLADITRGDPEAEVLARTVADEAQRASDIIGLLRGHIRPDQRAEPVDLARLVPDLAAKELDRLGFRGDRVFLAEGPIPAAVLTVGLGQVIRNLILNAVQATEKAGIAPADRRIEVAVIEKDGAAEVSVTDNGPGFSAEIRERLGEPFQTTKGDEGGMGLGLYVSSVLAQQMNASLRAESDAGGGARVVLTLDRGKGSLSTPSAERPS